MIRENKMKIYEEVIFIEDRRGGLEVLKSQIGPAAKHATVSMQIGRVGNIVTVANLLNREPFQTIPIDRSL